MCSFQFFFCALFIPFNAVNSATGSHEEASEEASLRNKRQLPLRLDCNVLSSQLSVKCYKGDLVDESIADCKRTSIFYTCDPINKYFGSTSVNVPDVSKHGVDCLPVSSKPVRCGDLDTRCVCDSPVDFTSESARIPINSCRCQYWPNTDIRTTLPAVCRQYDHGGVSGVHFYACCNNCNDHDASCDGDTYQGGGTTDKLCGSCGNRIPSQQSSRHTYTFNCGSCSEQRQCRDYCNVRHPLAAITPGLCPKWIGCFRGCCLNINPSFRGKRSATVNQTLFCGDNICSDEETVDTCPSDCCPTVNPINCPSNECTPNCCMGPSCCITSTQVESSASIHKQIFIYTLTVMALCTALLV